MRIPRMPTRVLALGATGLVLAGVMVAVGTASAALTRNEAENATIFHGAVESNWPGFSGAGFVNLTNEVGSYVEFTVTAANAGTATLSFRFANGSTTNRPMDITVNGVLASDELAFPSTTNWDTWATQTVTANLNAGANTIRATGTTASSGPNLDFLEFEVAPPATDYQAENATISEGVVESNHLGYTGNGFVNYNNLIGSYVQFTVTAANAGTATLSFRYANASTINRPIDITVNGVLASDELAFPSTTNWDTWATQTVTANLNAGTNTIRATATTANGGPNLDRLRIGAPSGGDTQPPSTPSNPLATMTTSSSISLAWDASTDNVGVTGYLVERCQGADCTTFSQVATPTGTTFTDPGLAASTTYRYRVRAVDAAGNLGGYSGIVAATTSPPAPTGYPQASSTGWPHGLPGDTRTPVTLSAYTGPCTINTPNTVIDSKDITCQINIRATGVLIKNSRFRVSNSKAIDINNVYHAVIMDTEMDGQHRDNSLGGISLIGDGSYTCIRCDIRGSGDGARANWGGVAIVDSWIHDPYCIQASCHNDGIQSSGWTDSCDGPAEGLGPVAGTSDVTPSNYCIRIVHTRIENPNTQTSNILLKADQGAVHDVLVENNLLNGGGYTFYWYDAGFQISNGLVRNNRFRRAAGGGFWPLGGYYGPVASNVPTSSRYPTWTNNVWDDNGDPIPF